MVAFICVTDLLRVRLSRVVSVQVGITDVRNQCTFYVLTQTIVCLSVPLIYDHKRKFPFQSRQFTSRSSCLLHKRICLQHLLKICNLLLTEVAYNVNNSGFTFTVCVQPRAHTSAVEIFLKNFQLFQVIPLCPLSIRFSSRPSDMRSLTNFLDFFISEVSIFSHRNIVQFQMSAMHQFLRRHYTIPSRESRRIFRFFCFARFIENT